MQTSEEIRKFAKHCQYSSFHPGLLEIIKAREGAAAASAVPVDDDGYYSPPEDATDVATTGVVAEHEGS